MRVFLAFALTLSTASVAHAADMTRECAVQGALIQLITDHRLDGKTGRRTERLIKKGMTEEARKYEDVLPDMVDYIFKMVPQEHLDDEMGKVWETQCLAAAQ